MDVETTIGRFCDHRHEWAALAGPDGSVREVELFGWLAAGRAAGEHRMTDQECWAWVHAHWGRVVLALTTHRRHA